MSQNLHVIIVTFEQRLELRHHLRNLCTHLHIIRIILWARCNDDITHIKGLNNLNIYIVSIDIIQTLQPSKMIPGNVYNLYSLPHNHKTSEKHHNFPYNSMWHIISRMVLCVMYIQTLNISSWIYFEKRNYLKCLNLLI